MNKKRKHTAVKSMSKGTKIFTYICLIWALLVALVPFVWLILSSFKSDPLARPGFQLPDSICLDGYISTFRDLHVMRYFGNSMIIAGVSVVISIVMISMSAYVVARMEFKGKGLVNVLLYSTMFIPATALTYPVYNMINRMKLYDTRSALILIYSCSGIAVSFFVIKNYYTNIPKELEEAARIDGLGEFGIFTRVFMPTMKSTYAAAIIVTFMSSWNNYLWPLIALQSPEKRTLPLVLSAMGSSYTPDYGMMMAAVVMATIPTALIFFLMQKHFVAGMTGSVKG